MQDAQGHDISHAILNEFIARCIEHARRQLDGEGGIRGTVHFGYGMEGGHGEADICAYELKRQDTDEAQRELAEIRAYAKRTGAEAVSITMELGRDAAADLFPESDGAILVAAVSPVASVGVIRPYAMTGGRVAFGEPKIIEPFEAPFVLGFFEKS